MAVETTLGVLDRGEWSRWPVVERDAVREFLQAFWLANLLEWPTRLDVDTDTLLSVVGQAEEDLTPYLDEWSALAGAAPVLHFATLLHDNAMRIATGKRIENFWLEDFPERELQVRTWLQRERERFAPRMDALLRETEDKHDRRLLVAALDVV